eukprot:6155938-Pyramimonas_sp.AAC.1
MVARTAQPKLPLAPSATANISIGRQVIMAGMVIAVASSTLEIRGARTVLINNLTESADVSASWWQPASRQP